MFLILKTLRFLLIPLVMICILGGTGVASAWEPPVGSDGPTLCGCEGGDIRPGVIEGLSDSCANLVSESSSEDLEEDSDENALVTLLVTSRNAPVFESVQLRDVAVKSRSVLDGVERPPRHWDELHFVRAK